MQNNIISLSDEERIIKSKISFLEKVQKQNIELKNKLGIQKDYQKVVFFIPSELYDRVSFDLKFDIHNKVISQSENITKIEFFPGDNFLSNYRKIIRIINSSLNVITELLKSTITSCRQIEQEKASVKKKIIILESKKTFLLNQLSEINNSSNEADTEAFLEQLSPRDILFTKAITIYKTKQITYIGALVEAINVLISNENAKELENDFTKWRKRKKNKKR